MQQNDFFAFSGSEQHFPMPGGGELRLISRWLESTQADRIFSELNREIAWEQPEIRIYGLQRPIPRLQAWYGDSGASMIYSGTRFAPLPWLPVLLTLREQIQQQFKTEFNSVLVNKYRDGQDSVGWHADDEPELGSKPIIASLSLGAARKFCLKPKPDFALTSAKAFALELGHGDLLLMSGEVQMNWLHAVLKEKHAAGCRINLTFRRIVIPSA